MSDWQPIETAPKDGTSVLLLELLFEDLGAQAQNYTVATFRRRDGWVADIECKPMSHQDKITHWMPLPDPPKCDSD
jgi:hypothetical protein